MRIVKCCVGFENGGARHESYVDCAFQTKDLKSFSAAIRIFFVCGSGEEFALIQRQQSLGENQAHR
jgi:hypothetical protein